MHNTSGVQVICMICGPCSEAVKLNMCHRLAERTQGSVITRRRMCKLYDELHGSDALTVKRGSDESLAQMFNQVRLVEQPPFFLSDYPRTHAEILAIREAASNLENPRLENCDLYLTLEPCPMCATAISFARVRRLYFGAYDPKGGGVDQANPLADRLCLVDRILPPAATTETAGVVIKVIGCIQRAKIIRTLKPVDTAKLRAPRFLPFVNGGGAQGPARFTFLIGVMQYINMLVGFFVFARRIFGSHPTAIAFGVQ